MTASGEKHQKVINPLSHPNYY